MNRLSCHIRGSQRLRPESAPAAQRATLSTIRARSGRTKSGSTFLTESARFGQLKLSQVTCETAHRLHVHVFNTAPSRYDYQVPSDTLPRSKGNSSVCDLSFDYDQAPFNFWITNKLSEDIIFDTRGQPSMIFEEGYLQIGSSLPTGANIYVRESLFVTCSVLTSLRRVWEK